MSYQILGTHKNASEYEIEQAYKKRVFENDSRNEKDSKKKQEMQKRLQQCSEAYQEIMEQREQRQQRKQSNELQIYKRDFNNLFYTPFNTPYTTDLFYTPLPYFDFKHIKERLNELQPNQFYSKSSFTTTQNGRRYTTYEENINGDIKTYEEYS
jgi:DnaJ-class molecular chaperone